MKNDRNILFEVIEEKTDWIEKVGKELIEKSLISLKPSEEEYIRLRYYSKMDLEEIKQILFKGKSQEEFENFHKDVFLKLLDKLDFSIDNIQELETLIDLAGSMDFIEFIKVENFDISEVVGLNEHEFALAASTKPNWEKVNFLADKDIKIFGSFINLGEFGIQIYFDWHTMQNDSLIISYEINIASTKPPKKIEGKLSLKKTSLASISAKRTLYDFPTVFSIEKVDYEMREGEFQISININ